MPSLLVLLLLEKLLLLLLLPFRDLLLLLLLSFPFSNHHVQIYYPSALVVGRSYYPPCTNLDTPGPVLDQRKIGFLRLALWLHIVSGKLESNSELHRHLS